MKKQSHENYIKVRCSAIKCKCCPHIETSQLICKAKQLTGFFIRATLALNGLSQGKGTTPPLFAPSAHQASARKQPQKQNSPLSILNLGEELSMKYSRHI